MNLAERLGVTAARLPDKTALVFQGQEVTYSELWERSGRAAAAFRQLGLEPGERVALLLGNSPAFVEAFYGALRAGLVVVPLNVSYTADEIAYILADADVRAVVAADPFAQVLAGISETLPALDRVLVAGATAEPVGGQSWRSFLDEAGDAEPPDAAGEGLALLQYTSGTTGRPKGAMLSHANLVANHEQMSQTRLKVEERDIILCVLPLFHIYALNVGMAFTLSRGATVLLVERFDALQTLEQVAAHRASIIMGAPPMYVAWLNTPGVSDIDVASVRFAVSGAAPLPAAVLERFQAQLGIPIWEGYGLTETAPALTTVAMGDEVVPGSVGLPLPDVEVRLVDEAGAPVRQGDPGEVLVRGPNVFSGYWNQPEATAEVLDDDGWFHTGDVGYCDERGYLYLVDRKKDLIIVSGFNVYPREVEEVIARHPKVAQVAVIGTPHPFTGEAVKAVVVLRDDQEASGEEIATFCQSSLARFKCPEVVEFASELPILATGKVARKELRS
jgi:long-chain acyl-CoA synthetase